MKQITTIISSRNCWIRLTIRRQFLFLSQSSSPLVIFNLCLEFHTSRRRVLRQQPNNMRCGYNIRMNFRWIAIKADANIVYVWGVGMIFIIIKKNGYPVYTLPPDELNVNL